MNADLRYSSCDVFVHGTDADDLHAVITGLAGAPVERSRAAARWSRDDVRVEAAFNPHAGGAGYRGWRWVVLVRAHDGQPAPDRVVRFVGALLETLWRQDVYAVASCAFADELPRGGGLGWML